MKSNSKIILVCALIALVHSSPFPQEEDFPFDPNFDLLDSTTVASPSSSSSSSPPTTTTTTTTTTTSTTTVRPTRPRPSPPRRPIITAIAQSIQNVNNAFTSTGTMFQTLLTYFTGIPFNQAAQTAQNVASSAGKLIGNAVQTMMHRVSSIANNMGIMRPFQVGTNITTVPPSELKLDPIPDESEFIAIDFE
ncbi:cell wall protein DAN4-like [Contarinia nasturtii]|uniref:cell wall protein DAN4-like n=1 Tax=Contarinia nasturtii TaxID=265458 RepID=UPI0012D3FAEE|nr:cell wall protein DAN4-like [Contarinia nasturtii]